MRHSDGSWVGSLGGELTWEALDCLAAALAEHVRRNVPGRRTVVLGHDGRFAAETLAERLAHGFQREGLAVELQTKPGPSAALASAIVSRRAALGALVTGGSAPPEIGGVAVRSESGAPLGSPRVERIQARLDELAAERRGLGPDKNGLFAPPVPRADFLTPYFEEMCRFVDFGAIRRLPPTRLAVDAMHGTASRYLEHLLAGTPVEVVCVRCRHDATFGGAPPDPSRPELLGPLRKAIDAKRCSWGCALSGDASRVAVLDSAGEAISPSTLLAVAFEHLVERRRAKGVLVRSPATDPLLDRVAESLKRRCVEVPADGLSSLAWQTRQETVALAGDETGAILFGSRPPDSEPFLLVLLLLEMTAATGLSVEGLAADLERRFWPARSARREVPGRPEFLRERFQFLLDDPPRRLGSVLAQRVSAGDGTSLKLSLRDGGWLLIRLDRGDVAARLDAGAQTSRRAERILDEGVALLLGSAGVSEPIVSE
jgi:phosphomannomutase